MKQLIAASLIFSLFLSPLQVRALQARASLPTETLPIESSQSNFKKKISPWILPVISGISGACFIGLGVQRGYYLSSDIHKEEFRMDNFSTLSKEEGKEKTIKTLTLESTLGLVMGLGCLSYTAYKIYQYVKLKKKVKQKSQTV